jgi:Zn-dependent protease
LTVQLPDIVFSLLQFLCLLFSLSVHEAAHAIMANRCGDPTGRLMGRATLNPIPHIDPIGTLILPLVMIFSGVNLLFGWAKPVPFNPRNLRNIRRDPALIGLAGPFSNLMLALTAAAVLKVAVVALGVHDQETLLYGNPVTAIIFSLVAINLVLMAFNMIPVPPLDGHHLLGSILPFRAQEMLERIGPFGILIAIFLFNPILRPPLMFLMKAVIWYALLGQTHA